VNKVNLETILAFPIFFPSSRNEMTVWSSRKTVNKQ